MACRLPGAAGPAAYWTLLSEGRDAVTEAPESRWPAGTAAQHRRAGFIEDVDAFDAAFFDISPFEAAAMDPQQRLTLELAWQALEDARLDPTRLRGSATGVFVGAINNDYATLHDRQGDEHANAYTLTGIQRGIIANRVSYALGLRGPSLTIDSGQSSSLVAVEAACESLHRGETGIALAAGVNLNLLPDTSDTIGRFGALSPDGRCHTFDSRANGYVRGEGGAVVVLKPLSAALADGDRVYSVILGGAVNNDGGGEGLTVPSARAQEEVVRLACARAGIRPEDVQYVELHGTGTPVGDPVEAAALGAALGAGRDEASRLLVGSAKTNIGHLEGAAGIAGLLKVVLSIRHRRLAPSLHFRTPHPDIPLDRLGLRMTTEARDWPDTGRPLVAGVSSFGMGGTNCHLILAEAPAPARDAAPAGPAATTSTTRSTTGPATTDAPPAAGTDDADGTGPATTSPATAGATPAGSAVPAPWVLSARSTAALQGQARALARHLDEHPLTAPDDIARSLVETRTEFEQRAVVLGADRERRLAALRALGAGRSDADVVTGAAVTGRTALVFPGQGTEWPEMAAALLGTAPVFTARITECAEALAPYVDYALLDVLRQTPGAPGLDRLDVVQPALWAVMVALAAEWRARGVEPYAVIGHSQGEIAAATVAGALSLSDAARVVALRARAVARLGGRGGSMLSVAAPREAVLRILDGRVPEATVAVENGPGAVVLSGPVEALTAAARLLEEAGERTRQLPIDYASHSPAVEELREEILDALAPVRPVSTGTLFVSTVTGEPVDTATLDAAYWYRNLRQTVEFARATRSALDHGCRVFVECSPHPVLVAGVEETAEQAEATAAAVGTLRRGDGGPDRLRAALAEAYVRGAGIDRTVLAAAPGAALTDLPPYAFERQRYWLPGATGTAAGEGEAAAAPAPVRSARDLLRLVLETTALIRGTDGDAVGPAQTFKELGLDSLGMVELRRRLTAATGLPLSTTVVFDHPTPQRLAGFLHDRLRTAASAAPATPAVRAAAGGDDEDDAVAIVAMGCRYPGGVGSPEELWRLVLDGTDATSEFPTNRGWDLTSLFGSDGSGTTTTRRGGFLHDADEFDAAFFGISPREALAMDPQQRLLLETTWETLERAGLDPEGLRGSDTGVFVGVMASDYGPRLDQPVDGTDGHLLTGFQTSVASGRVAYTFGFNGPALSVDTACSSSLVALHLAVQALRRGECSMALAGGVTLMSRPGTLVEFSRQNGLSPDGRCKPFSSSADGTAFAEGVGMLLLERLSDARRHGHQVLAVVRGSAVNQDGASNGLTAPNGPAQERVIRQALTDARLTADAVDAVEAHGTGTPLGDPIEAEALLATYGAAHPADRPLWLGSLKSNIGHTQAAAGVAGVIKMVLAMRNGLLPATLHLDEPTPHVDWTRGGVRPLAEAQKWPEADRPRRAAVSSFGISGTNAHVILEQAPEAGEPDATDTPDEPARAVPYAWVLSAHNETSLRAQAARLYDRVAADPALRPVDVAYSLARTRSLLPHRAVLPGRDREELLAAVAALRDGTPGSTVATGRARSLAQTAFLFTGQGGQRPGMGQELYAAFPVFARAFDEVCAAVDPHLDRPLRDVMWARPDTAEAALLNETRYTQPALFAYQVAAYALLESLGVRPDEIAGHSVGEIAAAHVAGVWDLADAARMVTARGRLMQGLPARGAMVAIAASADEVLPTLAGREDLVGIAAVNGPTSVVVSGDEETCLAVAAHWDGLGRRTKRLTVSHAFHSPLMEPMLDEFAGVLSELVFHTPRLSHVTDLTGTDVTAGWAEPAYWLEQIRRPVMFHSVVRELHDRKVTAFLEVGPRAALSAMAKESLDGAAATVAALHSRDRREEEALLGCLAEAFTAGAAVDWAALADGGRAVDLPTYAFDRRRSWLTGRDGADVASAGLRPTGHPMLRAVLDVAGDDGAVATGRLSVADLPWLADHRMGGRLIVPGTALLDLVLHTAEQIGCDHVAELTFESPVVLPEDGELQIQVVVGGPEDARTVKVFSRADASADWVRHASGVAATAAPPATARAWAAAWPPADATPVPFDTAYDQLADAGYDYGPAFRAVRAVWRRDDVLFAEIVLPDGLTADGYGLHPVLLDAALHPYVAGSGELRLPFAFQDVSLTATDATALRVRLTPDGADALAVEAADETGQAVLTAGRLHVRAVPAAFLAERADRATHLYRLGWEEFPAQDAPTASWVAVGAPVGGLPGHGSLDELADALGTDGRLDGAVLTCPAGADATRATEAALAAVQRWLSDDRFDGARLVLVTRGAVRTGPGETADPAQAAVWGLVRSAQAENPDRFALVDTDGSDDDALRRAAACGEPQLAVRAGALRVPRLTRASADDALVPPAEAPAWRLAASGDGTLDGLSLVPYEEALRPLAEGEVRLGIRAAGLNFRDVVVALGMVESPHGLGWEAAGVVLETGPGVTRLAVGDRVMGLVPGSYGPVAVADARTLAPVPEGWTFAQAASVPAVFLTAYYALIELADLRAGESVLIHAATGGVGMAAVQLARHLGAEVFGTASHAKWPTLRAMGLDETHIASSRDLDFEEHVLDATGGKGVDVVLDSLAGEFVDASLRALGSTGGRFIEMGKTDIRDPQEVADRHPGVTYRAFDLPEAGPELIGRMLDACLRLFEAGVLEPLPVTAWDVRRAPEAFRHVSQARHTGKVVLTIPRPIDPDGTALITG
ncbi:beta-ketoacyl synthase N-terminal-like domain-containing protein, partial [Streptomyces griseosporeus]|uniref:beta-ketoacyl synthase N-terminal-like domain-containing protein n=1 Tax=Streptomyces griseosporeus TaxID=1910 RepID=UPI0036FF7E6E